MDLSELHITYRNLVASYQVLRRCGFPADAMTVVVQRQTIGGPRECGLLLHWFDGASPPGVTPPKRTFAVGAGPLPCAPEDLKTEWNKIAEGLKEVDPRQMQNEVDRWLVSIGGAQRLIEALGAKRFVPPVKYADPAGRGTLDGQGGKIL